MISRLLSVITFWTCFYGIISECPSGLTETFTRWSAMVPVSPTPVFVYAASGDEASLTDSCLSRCRELSGECRAVVVAYGTGNCYGVAALKNWHMTVDSDVAYFQKICLKLPPQCKQRWWSLESTPGYRLHSEGSNMRIITNSTIQECYSAIYEPNDQLYRSAQWIGQSYSIDTDNTIKSFDGEQGMCVLNVENKFTEAESYRVANYQTVYIEDQCRHDYSKKIDRCSYEEYYNQTLKHVEFTINKYTKDECRSACENEVHFVCRGFTWTVAQGRGQGRSTKGICDLHSEDLLTTGSWLLKKTSSANYYRRVICLNMTVECIEQHIVVTYRPRGLFRGRVYVPGRGKHCSARGNNNLVSLKLPLYGDCDVQFAHAISNTAQGVVNRTMAYVMVMIQNNPIIQMSGDRWVRVGCSPNASLAHTVDAVIAVRDAGKPSTASEDYPVGRNPAPASSVLNNSPVHALTMYVVRAENSSPPPSATAVTLGEPLELRVETTEENEIEAYHLVASSRLGDSSVLLLDSRGCPTDQVDFPAFTRTWLSGTQRLSARFKAFRFPTSHVVRFALMVRYCDGKCPPKNCEKISRATRETNSTESFELNVMMASIREELPRKLPRGVVAQGGATDCTGVAEGRIPLVLEVMVGGKDILTTDNFVKADHQSTQAEDELARRFTIEGSVVCVHELLLVALALAWLAVQILLLLGCCVLVKRYRNLAEMNNMQKDYHMFDNVGFDTISTHRRVHWPDQSIDILHTT